MQTKDLVHYDGEVRLNSYLAYDEKATGKRPGILVFPEAFGLGENAMRRARMLVELGYVALAADPFGDRKQLNGMEEVMAVVGELRSDPQRLRKRARSALSALVELPQVDTGRLAAIGYCFGGTTVLEMARDGAPLKGVVSFHGGLETVAPAKAGGVKASVLACTGADDPMVPHPQVAAFEQEMREAGADWQVIAYGNAVHSFTNPSADGSMPGIKYEEKADRRSWEALKTFFGEVLA